jgi:hypothetical protein
LALQELIDLGPEGSDFFNRLADLSGLNVDSARDLILEYGNIVARNSGQPPAALFEGLKRFTDDNVGITQVLLDKYGNVITEAGKDAPTRFFASLDGQIDNTASKISGLAGQLSSLNSGLDEAERRNQAILSQVPLLSAAEGTSVISDFFQPGQKGGIVQIQNATFQTPSDADRVAQAVLAGTGVRLR